MTPLSEKEWREFSIDELFTVSAGKRLTNVDKTDGDRPFVGATDNTNGVTGFVGNTNASLDRNVLGVNYNGAPCNAFYHPYECVFTDDVKRLHLRDYEDGEDILLFFATLIKQQRLKYGYGYKCNEKRMVRQKIMLPVDEDGQPDFEYMEQYAAQKRQELLDIYRNYAAERMAGLEHRDIPALDEKEWRNFPVTDIFSEIQRGKRLKNADHVPGDTPYVSSTAMNNGVDDYVEATPGTRVFENCISLANSGSVGTAFYEPFSFVASDHVTSLKQSGMSEFTYLFLAAALKKQSVNFNFNREINDQRIRKMQVMLPADDKGQPDYAYMKQYVMNIMLDKYQQYLIFVADK